MKRRALKGAGIEAAVCRAWDVKGAG